MDKHSTFAYRNLGLALLQQKKFDQSIEALKNAVKFSSGGLAFESYLGFAYAVAGQPEEAVRVLDNLQVTDQERYVPAYNFAVVYTGLGDFDQAFEWFDHALKERSGFMPFLKVEPTVDGLRGDPRFQDLLNKIGLVN